MKRLVSRTLSRAFHSRIGYLVLTLVLRASQHRVFSSRTVQMMQFDLLRLRARVRHPSHKPKAAAPTDRLHFGCGNRRVPGWLNVDVAGAEFDVDLAAGSLPWRDSEFAYIAAQQVIEHLELQSE